MNCIHQCLINKNILLEIFKWLPKNDLHRFRTVNKLFKLSYEQELLWKYFVKKEINDEHNDYRKILNKNTYFETYKTYQILFKFNRRFNLEKNMKDLIKLEQFYTPCKLKKVPKECSYLINLKELNIHHNKLIEVPREIGNLINLQTLHLDHNELEKVPEELGNLVNLKEIRLGFNRLKKIPKTFGKLINLENLYLQMNELIEVPEELGNLTNLRLLWLMGNRLEKIPSIFKNLKNLQELQIQNNRLKEMPMDVVDLTGLRYLFYDKSISIPSQLRDFVRRFRY